MKPTTLQTPEGQPPSSLTHVSVSSPPSLPLTQHPPHPKKKLLPAPQTFQNFAELVHSRRLGSVLTWRLELVLLPEETNRCR